MASIAAVAAASSASALLSLSASAALTSSGVLSYVGSAIFFLVWSMRPVTSADYKEGTIGGV